MRTNAFLTAIVSTLQTYLKPALIAEGLPVINKFVKGRVTPSHSEQAPFCWVFSNGWSQSTADGERTIGAVHGAHVRREYTVYVCVAYQGSDEAQVDQALQNYADVITEVLETNWNFGQPGVVLNSDVTAGSVSPSIDFRDKIHYRMAAVTVVASVGRILGGAV